MLGIARVNQRNYAILAVYSKELPNKNDVDLRENGHLHSGSDKQ